MISNIAGLNALDIADRLDEIEQAIDAYYQTATGDEDHVLGCVDWPRFEDAFGDVRRALRKCARLNQEPGPERLTLADVLPQHMIGRA